MHSYHLIAVVVIWLKMTNTEVISCSGIPQAHITQAAGSILKEIVCN